MKFSAKGVIILMISSSLVREKILVVWMKEVIGVNFFLPVKIAAEKT
jgi:hypothetical protein